MQKPSIVARLKSDQAVAVGFISPALVVLSCVIAIPILRGIWTSFCDCSPAQPDVSDLGGAEKLYCPVQKR